MERQTKWYAFFPNLLTILNLLSGAVAIYFALNNNIELAVILMFAGAIFDFFDGFVARLLKVSGELGKQLDSLADVVTFVVLPGAIVFSTQRFLVAENSYENLSLLQWIFILSPLLIPAFSALRLAKFNIDTRQSKSFIVLPTSANALFFASLCYSITLPNNTIGEMADNPLVLFILTVIFSYLLVSPIPMFSLKFSSYGFKKNLATYLFLILSIVLIVFFTINAISAVIILYILISLVLLLKK